MLAFSDVSDGVDDAEDAHQETDFAVDSANGSMTVMSNPGECSYDSGYGGQQEYPPENPCDYIFVFCETSKPVARFIMKIYVVTRENNQYYSKHNVHP